MTTTSALVLPRPPVFLRAAVLVLLAWTGLSTLLGFIGSPMEPSIALALTLMAAFNVLVLFHVQRGDAAGWVGLLVMQLGSTALALSDGRWPSAHGGATPDVLDWACGLLEPVSWVGLLHPLTRWWFRDVRILRRLASPVQRLAEARFQLVMALVWGFMAAAALEAGAFFTGPQLPAVLVISMTFGVVGCFMLFVQTVRFFVLAKELRG